MYNIQEEFYIYSNSSNKKKGTSNVPFMKDDSVMPRASTKVKATTKSKTASVKATSKKSTLGSKSESSSLKSTSAKKNATASAVKKAESTKAAPSRKELKNPDAVVKLPNGKQVNTSSLTKAKKPSLAKISKVSTKEVESSETTTKTTVRKTAAKKTPSVKAPAATKGAAKSVLTKASLAKTAAKTAESTSESKTVAKTTRSAAKSVAKTAASKTTKAKATAVKAADVIDENTLTKEVAKSSAKTATKSAAKAAATKASPKAAKTTSSRASTKALKSAPEDAELVLMPQDSEEMMSKAVADAAKNAAKTLANSSVSGKNVKSTAASDTKGKVAADCACPACCAPHNLRKGALLPHDDVEIITAFFKALSDPTRFNIVYVLLTNGELSVGEVAERTNMSMSAVSHQLALLRMRKLVTARRVGVKNLYALCDDHVFKVIEMAVEHVHE